MAGWIYHGRRGGGRILGAVHPLRLLAPPGSARYNPAVGKRKTILIVDDSQAVVDALTAAFEESGYAVAAAGDGEEVFRRMTAFEPEAVLLDIYMPKLNGADVCRLVKAHPHWKRTFLVLMSSRISDREIDGYRRMGADEILKKPFDPDAAVQIVARAIGAA
jgi:twitching motility two-component system response regulator PilG/twitching motility two-component system response regulator PilH